MMQTRWRLHVFVIVRKCAASINWPYAGHMGRGNNPATNNAAASATIRSQFPAEEDPGFLYPSPDPRAARLFDFEGRSHSPGAIDGPRSTWPSEYNDLLIEFPKSLTEEEQDRATGIICYWAKFAYVSGGTTENEWRSPRLFWIDATSRGKSGGDWRAKRDIFEELENFCLNGTNISKKTGRRLWDGLGIKPSRIFLSPGSESRPRPEVAEKKKVAATPGSEATSLRDFLSV